MILITGSSGFIGKELCKALIKDGKEIIGFDKESNPAVKTYLGDITKIEDLESVFKNNPIKKVVHLAGIAKPRGVKDYDTYLNVNVKGTLNVLEASQKYGVEQVIFASSSAVYGPQKTPFSEEAATIPVSMYGITKRMCESLCFLYFKKYSLPSTCLRFFTVYGEQGRQDMAVYTFTKLINEGMQINMFGDGTLKRDYIHISDVIHGIKKALRNYSGFDIINLGSGKGTDLKSLVGLLEDCVGKKAKINYAQTPKDEDFDTTADIEKARKLLGWEPQIALEEGIKRFVEWYKQYLQK